MSLKSKKAATKETSGKCVRTPAGSTQPRPNAHDASNAGTVPAPGIETDRFITVPAAKAKTKKLSSTDLTAPKIGAVIEGLDHIGQNVYAQLVKIAPDFEKQLEKLGSANDAQLKKQFDEYKEEDYKLGEGITTMLKKRRQLFRENIGLFWTIHECIVSPGFRSDLNGGQERTADYNFKIWGASTWQEFVERYSPYGLDSTDNYVKEFGREYGRLLNDGVAGATKLAPAQQDKEVGNARPKKKRCPTALETVNGKLALEFKSMCNLALNSNATDEQIAATWKSKAQETYKNLTPAETNALKMPKILGPKLSELEKLGISLAKQVWASTLLPADSKEKQDAHKVLLAAGVAATMTPSPTKGRIETRAEAVINDQDAEYLMMRVARGNSVDPDVLAKYELWLAAKGETERATALRRELSDWKDAMAKKGTDPTLNGAPAGPSVGPAASAVA